MTRGVIRVLKKSLCKRDTVFCDIIDLDFIVMSPARTYEISIGIIFAETEKLRMSPDFLEMISHKLLDRCTCCLLHAYVTDAWRIDAGMTCF